MPFRFALVCGVVVIGASSALAGAPLVRTLARAHGVGHVTLGVSTAQLRSRLWLQRIGGSGPARGSGDVSCEQKTTSVGSSGVDEMFAFGLPPNSRQTVWRFGGTQSCVVTVSVRGKERLVVALRGY